MMIEIHFSIPGHESNYIIHRQGEYLEILYEDNRRRVGNEKDVCRAYGLNIPTDANEMNSHTAMKRLVERLAQDM
jgi:hypothetical protein